MNRVFFAITVFAWLLSPSHVVTTSTNAEDDTTSQLQGEWIARYAESDGEKAPKEVVKRIRFVFRGDRLFIKGNFDDDREEECTFKVDPSKSPKQLDFTPATEKKPVLGIYEVDGNDLKICVRQGVSTAGRPTEFSTKPDSRLVLIIFKKQRQP